MTKYNLTDDATGVQISLIDGTEKTFCRTANPPFYYYWSPNSKYIVWLSNSGIDDITMQIIDVLEILSFFFLSSFFLLSSFFFLSSLDAFFVLMKKKKKKKKRLKSLQPQVENWLEEDLCSTLGVPTQKRYSHAPQETLS